MGPVGGQEQVGNPGLDYLDSVAHAYTFDSDIAANIGAVTGVAGAGFVGAQASTTAAQGLGWWRTTRPIASTRTFAGPIQQSQTRQGSTAVGNMYAGMPHEAPPLWPTDVTGAELTGPWARAGSGGSAAPHSNQLESPVTQLTIPPGALAASKTWAPHVQGMMRHPHHDTMQHPGYGNGLSSSRYATHGMPVLLGMPEPDPVPVPVPVPVHVPIYPQHSVIGAMQLLHGAYPNQNSTAPPYSYEYAGDAAHTMHRLRPEVGQLTSDGHGKRARHQGPRDHTAPPQVEWTQPSITQVCVWGCLCVCACVPTHPARAGSTACFPSSSSSSSSFWVVVRVGHRTALHTSPVYHPSLFYI